MSNSKIISIGCDHAGFECKLYLIKKLKQSGFEIIDEGTFTSDPVDYPDFSHLVAKDIVNQKAEFGIVLCGTGNGVAMTVNKYPQIRGALCWNRDISRYARSHNDANILAIPARYVSKKMAFDMTKIFLETKFEGGRHEKRIEKIPIK